MSRKAAFVYHDSMSRHVLRADHPLRAVRLKYTYELLDAYHAFEDDNSTLVEPRPATEEEITGVHDTEYVEAVKRASAKAKGSMTPPGSASVPGEINPIYEGMYERPC